MIGAICDKEPANFLAVNLAHEVATGKRSVEDARQQYAQSIELLMKENKTDKYTSGLVFNPPAQAGFSDQPYGSVGHVRSEEVSAAHSREMVIRAAKTVPPNRPRF